MQYRKLPNTDITLSAVTLGCMTFTGDSNWGPQEEKDSIATAGLLWTRGSPPLIPQRCMPTV